MHPLCKKQRKTIAGQFLQSTVYLSSRGQNPVHASHTNHKGKVEEHTTVKWSNSLSKEKKKKRKGSYMKYCVASQSVMTVYLKQSIPAKALHLSNHKNHSIHKFQTICKNPSSLFTFKPFNLQPYEQPGVL